MHIGLRNGHNISAPLARFPRLLHGTAKQRDQWQVIDAGDGLHWQLLDEHISVKGLISEPVARTDYSTDIGSILAMVGDIYARSSELRRISGRRFTLDGIFVATTGQVVAEYVYGLTRRAQNDAHLQTEEGRSVKVALTGEKGSGFAIRWTQAAMRSHADLLVCLQLNEHGFREIYNGEFPVEQLQDRKVSPGGQIQLPLALLSDLNPALLDKVHSLSSINDLLTVKLGRVA